MIYCIKFVLFYIIYEEMSWSHFKRVDSGDSLIMNKNNALKVYLLPGRQKCVNGLPYSTCLYCRSWNDHRNGEVQIPNGFTYTSKKNHISQIFNHFEPMEKVLILLSFQDTYYTDYVPQHSGDHTARRIHFCELVCKWSLWFVQSEQKRYRQQMIANWSI